MKIYLQAKPKTKLSKQDATNFCCKQRENTNFVLQRDKDRGNVTIVFASN